MRVAHISDCYLPRTGGIELQVRGLCQAELSAGLTPEVITATPASRKQAVIPGESDDGVPVHRLSIRLPAQLPVTPYVGERLLALLGSEFDAVHVHGGLVSPFAWPALRTVVRAELPVVVSVHSVWAGWSRAFSATDRLYRWRDWPVVWTTVSDVAAQPLRQALGGRAEVRLLPNGIDIHAWQSRDVAEAKPADAHELTVVAVSRLAPRKRIRALVEILRRTSLRMPAGVRLRAIIVGDGPERAKIERTIRRHQMGWVECRGWQTHSQIRDIYSAADVFVAPARLESFGIAALEARTFGLPVVAMADSGTAQFIRDGQEGFLATDDSGIEQALLTLANRPDQRAAIARHNRTVTPEFSWPHIVDQAVGYYQEAIRLRESSR